MNPDFFDNFLGEFSHSVGLTLRRDSHNICCLQVGERLKVHIAPDKHQQIFIFAFLEEIGPGKFREEVLKEGLKANGLLLPGGVIGYSGKNGCLSLHLSSPPETSAATLFEAFLAFVDYATQWQTALSQGRHSPLSLTPKSVAPPPLGLR